ncbi:flagellar protein FlgN [Planococcus halocryophilus]|uniref:flagellar protein FlgN n=1 Tax=Planococcus halocryophilus TaxID=1215089 RepID=UPI001F0EA522|nr:flagellar protein FlgN [Planococcus halocryophilus]MCH4827623.1 flagellar protein FlgN [Planococcus halocryophilus]
MLNLVVNTLDELISIQKQLIRYAERKQTVLIERKVDELTELVKEEAKLVKQLGQLEDERQQLVADVLEEHPGLTFSQFAEQIPDEDVKQDLHLQLKTLQTLLTELQAKNKTNEKLLEDSMSFVQHMITEVTKSKQQQYNYQSPAGQQKPQSNNQGFFDTRA